MRKTPSYRSVAVLAVLALLLSAFSPAAAPCVKDDAPPEVAMPCHGGMAGGAIDHEAPPDAPEHPAPPRSVMTCCNGGAATAATTARAEADLGAAAAVVLAGVALPAPSSQPQPVQATDTSPPTPARLHLLFGCFLT